MSKNSKNKGISGKSVAYPNILCINSSEIIVLFAETKNYWLLEVTLSYYSSGTYFCNSPEIYSFSNTFAFILDIFSRERRINV
jgi:hypothetical protein